MSDGVTELNGEPFTQESLQALYYAISANDGVSVAELRELLGEFSDRPIAKADLHAYREGRKPWKKLRDEVVPVQHFLSSEYPDNARVRFPLDDQPPDAWVTVDNDDDIGIEVTGALARAGVEVGKSLAEGKPVPGFIALQDNATQHQFDQARARGRVTHSRKGVDSAIDRAITARLEGKDKQKYADQILLITAPISSSPNRNVEDLQTSHGEKAQALPFAKVFVMDGARGSPIVRLK
jgi:hypothetical protein